MTLSRRRRAAASEPAGVPGPVDVLLAELAETAEPRIAVLVESGRGGLAGRVRRRMPGARVTRLQVAKPRQLHLRLSAAGPFDAVVDASRKPAVRGRLFRCAFWHLRPGGVYLAVAHVDQERTLGAVRPAASLGATLERARPAATAPIPSRGRARRDLAALGRAVQRVEERGGHLVVVNGTAALAKVVEKQADRLLHLRGGADRVLHQEPGAELVSRCELTCSGERPSNMPALIEAPPLSLREYSGAVCVPGQVLVSGNLLLPDTYRHNQRRRLTNMHTTELGRRFASVDVDLDSAPVLEGTYFYLDNEVRGHFGHALTEQVSLLWALDAARRHASGLKAVVSVRGGHHLHPFERELFAAAGLGADDLVVLEQPTRVERLLAATPSLSMPEYVHPLIAQPWAEIGDALARKATLDPEHDRIFVGRRVAKRTCRNADEVEALFTERGFTVVYPEDYALPDQVALFRRAEVIAGYGGSGLFQMCFVPEPRTVIQVRADTYTANNEYLMASVLGHRLVSVVGRNDRTEDEERRQAKRFQSSFRVDLDQEGGFLRRVLADL